MKIPAVLKHDLPPYVLPVLLFALTALIFIVNVYGLSGGVTNVLPHLFYLPIVIASYYYPRRGAIFTAILSVIYCAMVYAFNPTTPDVLESAIARAIVFIFISVVVSYLSYRLKQDNRQLADIINVLPDATFVIDREGKVVAWNHAIETMSGISSDEMMGQGGYAYSRWAFGTPRPILIDYVLRQDFQSIKEEYPTNLTEGSIVRIETELLRPDGTRLSLWVSAAPLNDPKGKISGAVESIRDVTDIKGIDRALKDSRRFLDKIIDTIADPVFVKDRQYRFVLVNDAFCAFTSRSRKEHIGQTDYDFFSKEESDVCRNRDEEVFRTGAADENEESFTINGNRYTVITKRTLYTDSSGEKFIVGIVRDTTERNRAEKALRESEMKFRDFVEFLPQQVLETGMRGEVRFLNHAAMEVLGYSREDVEKGLNAQNFVIPGDQGRIGDMVERISRGERPGGIEFTGVRKDGSTFPVVIYLSPVIHDGQTTGMRGVAIDISDRNKMERALRLANKKLTILSSITRHDILNQLTALRSYLELSKGREKDPVLAGFIANEETAAEAIGRQIEFTRYYENIGINVPRWQDVAHLIRSSGSQLPLGTIILTVTLGGVEVYADPLIEKVFYNLIENSLRHGGHVTRIGFSFTESVEGGLLVYEDNGTGIRMEDRDQLFTRGFGKHTGLGLFLSREILAITDIVIRENGQPHKGVRFEIVIPKDGYRFTRQP